MKIKLKEPITVATFTTNAVPEEFLGPDIVIDVDTHVVLDRNLQGKLQAGDRLLMAVQIVGAERVAR